MDSQCLSNRREHRRKAAASRRAVREKTGDDSTCVRDLAKACERPETSLQQQQKRLPLESKMLSSLSQALTNIDKHNTDYFPGKGGKNRSNGCAPRYEDDFERKPRVYTNLPPPSQFSSYFNFTRSGLNFLLAFAMCYLLVLVCCYPMISNSNEQIPNDDEVGAKHHIKRGASFQHIRGRKQFIKVSHAVTDKLGTLKERALQWEEQAKVKASLAEIEIIDTIATGTIGRKDGADAKKASLLLERTVKGRKDGVIVKIFSSPFVSFRLSFRLLRFRCRLRFYGQRI